MFIVKAVSRQEYATYVENIGTRQRYFHTHLPEYGDMRAQQHTRCEYYLFYRDQVRTENACGMAIVTFLSWKKIFFLADCIYGPIVDVPDANEYREAMAAFKKTVRSSWRVRRGLVNPIIALHRYEDTTIVEENCGLPYAQALIHAGYTKEKQTTHDNPLIQSDMIYSRNIKGLTYDQVLASVKQVLRNRIKKTQKLGVRVRFLSRDELPVFVTALKATYSRVNTKEVPSLGRIEALFDCFGSRIFFPVAYVDVDDSLVKNQAELDDIAVKQQQLDERFAGNTEAKKYVKQLNVLNEHRRGSEKTRQKLVELREKYGAEVVLNVGCYIHCGADFIHFLGGGDADLMSFDGTSAIHDHMLREATSRDVTYYNMFGVVGGLEENDIDFGVLQFKRFFNGHVEHFIGTYRF